jgi:hypothetical protein
MVPMPLRDVLFKKLVELEDAVCHKSRPKYKEDGSDIEIHGAHGKWIDIQDAILEIRTLVRTHLK